LRISFADNLASPRMMPELLRMASGQRVLAAFFRVSKSSVLILTLTCTVRLLLVSIQHLSLLLYSFLARILLVLFVRRAFGGTMQAEQSTQLTQVPPQPTCTQIFNTGTCADLWKNYRQALAQRQREEAQLYVNRQREQASSEATAPLQQQIVDFKKLVADQQGEIKKLQEKMQQQIQADSATTQQAKSAVHSQGLQQGVGIGVAISLLLFGVIFGIKKLTGRVRTKPQARAAASAS